jgi:hypothetical protein
MSVTQSKKKRRQFVNLTPCVPSGRTFRPSLLVETFRVNPLSVFP